MPIKGFHELSNLAVKNVRLGSRLGHVRQELFGRDYGFVCHG
jgi:hypothetical protein